MKNNQQPKPGFVKLGGALSLSNLGQLALLEAMMVRGVPLRMPVRGFSMEPSIRDRDVLTIAPVNVQEPKVGDVVAFTTPKHGRLAVHRVVAREGSQWVLQGDNCPEADGLVRIEKILGRVVRIERQGRDVRLGCGAWKAWAARLRRNTAVSWVRRVWRLPYHAAHTALRRLQGWNPYRRIGKGMMGSITIREAAEQDLLIVHRRFNPANPYIERAPNPNVRNWVACRGKRVIGFVQYVHIPDKAQPWAGHWLFSLHVWPGQRGLGVGEALTRCVIDHAHLQGAENLQLAVYEDNFRAISLYQKVGFALGIVAALEPSLREEQQRTGRRRVTMSLPLVDQKIDYR